MKLKLLQHLSGVDGVKEVGEEIDVTDAQAVAFIEKGIAEPKTAKELNAFLKKIDGLKTKKLEAEAQANSILEKSVIQNELNELYLAVVLKEAELNGEVLNDEEILESVEAISKRDAVATKEAGSN